MFRYDEIPSPFMLFSSLLLQIVIQEDGEVFTVTFLDYYVQTAQENLSTTTSIVFPCSSPMIYCGHEILM